ncbi:MAG TPA: hypothetical protein VES42_02675, partial [Pilimelia sp.]|nr:hypothetical protein [Pilimelia sp.]
TTAPAFRDAEIATRASGTSISIPAPATQAGDLLIAVVSANNFNGTTWSTPAGWTSMGGEASGWYQETRAYYRLAAATPPASYTFSYGDSSDAAGTIVAYSGVDQTNPISTHTYEVGEATYARAPTVNVARANSLFVVGYTYEGHVNGPTPTGMTKRGATPITGNSAQDLQVRVHDELRGATGATGSRTSTYPSGDGRYHGYSIVVQPPAPTKDPTVSLSWPIASDTAVTGYSLVRTNGATTVTVPISGRATAAHTDSTTTATVAYTYELRSTTATAWRSTARTANAAICP